MNPAIAVALLALAQLGLAWLTGRIIEGIDKPLFADQVRRYEQLGIKDFFTTTDPDGVRGDMRTAEVLRLAALAPAARATITALAVTCIGLVVTAVIVGTTDPAPAAESLRLIASIVGAVFTAFALFVLLVKLASRSLRAHAQGELPITRWSVKAAAQRYRTRLKSSNVLAPYLTIAFFGNILAIASAAGL